MRLSVTRNCLFDGMFARETGYTVIKVNDYAQAIRLFRKRRIDGSTAIETSLHLHMQDLDLPFDIFEEPYRIGRAETWVYMASRSRFLSQKAEFVRALKVMVKQNRYLEIMQKYILAFAASEGRKAR